MFVDFHSHVLPRADHGAKNSAMSLSQLREASLCGIDTVVATPHFYIEHDTVDSFLSRRESCYSALEEKNDTGVKVIKAAEVRLDIGISELPDLEKLCIGNTKYILLEFPPEPWQYWYFDFLKEIEARGLCPVIAHIDRYSARGREKLLSLGYKTQINATALLGFGKKKYYSKLIEEDKVHVIGSDSHGDGTDSYPFFVKAARKLGDNMEKLAFNSRRILTP